MWRFLAGLMVIGLVLSGVVSASAADAQGRAQQQDDDGVPGWITPDAPPLRLEDIDGVALPPLVDGRLSDVDSLIFVKRDGQAVEPAAPQAAAIDVWYGPIQSFGAPGLPQDWVNVLGQVTGTAPYTLTYSLNSSAAKSLPVGSDNYRLTHEGDFNIELDPTTLNASNTIQLNLQDSVGDTISTTVTVNYTAGNTWPLPYTATWSGDLQDIAQAVDGDWIIDNGAVELAGDAALGYDRVLTIGDPGWDNYEVTVPVTVRKLDPKGYDGVNNGPNVGVALRWRGHFEEAGEGHPYRGWQNIGALAIYRWYFAGGVKTEAMQMYGFGGAPLTSNNTKPLEINTPYVFKMSVQSAAAGPAYYRFKMWKAADPEPLKWDMEIFGKEGEPASGSLVLQAHYTDVQFGQVKVESIDSIKPKLTVPAVEHGSVVIVPEKDEYDYGESVSIWPVPDLGYRLGSWGGDASGTDDPLHIFMTKDTTVVPNFEEAPNAKVTITPSENGQARVEPDKPQYTYGETISLIATPDEGYQLYSWGGNQLGNANPLAITLEGDVNVAPTYGPLRNPLSDDFNTCQLDAALWSFVDPVGDSNYAVNDAQTVEIGLPGGTRHDYWAGRLEAPRLMQAAQDVDMDLVAKFESTVKTEYQMQGIAIEGADDKTISANFYGDGSKVHVFIGAIDGAIGTPKVDEIITPPTNSDLYLRVTRVGAQWTLSHSFDGAAWTVDGSFPFAMEVQQVGVYAGNAGAQLPAHTAKVDYFFNTGAPIDPEDGASLGLTVKTEGQGTVTKSPDKAAYACGEEITLTATPAPDWRFAGWRGDVSGSDNPAKINYNIGDTVTGVFIPESGVGNERVYLPIATKQ
jgi:hypothetical protein